MKQVWSVGRVASWAGFCLPCGREDRPLVLTRSGASGLRAWVAGIGDDDRTLLLTCRVCGEWQVVPLREEDDPELVVDHEPPSAARVEDVRVELRVPVAVTAAPVRPVDQARLVALPSIAVPAPGVPPEAVAAARSVLSAARAAASTGGTRTSVARTSAGKPRSSRRRGPTPRRPDTAPTRRGRTVAPVRAVAPVVRAVATSTLLPGETVLDLLASGHQVVLSPAR